MVKFGMPSLVEMPSIPECAALCRELGLDFIELNTNFPLQQPHLMDVNLLNELRDQYGIFYTIHLNDETPVADFSPSVARGYCESVLETIELARKIGIQKLNMHISEGAHYTMPDRIVYFYEAFEEEYLKGMLRFRKLCEDALADTDMMICMENSKPYHKFQRKALDLLLESPVFGLTWDIGHNYCSKQSDEGWILERADRLHHMHLHDAKEGHKDHLALGDGEIDIPKYLQVAYDRDCTVLLETKTIAGLRKSAQWVYEHKYSH